MIIAAILVVILVAKGWKASVINEESAPATKDGGMGEVDKR